MLWIELMRKGSVSLLQSQLDTQYCVCTCYYPNAKEDSQFDGGTYFSYFGLRERKAEALQKALDYFRYRTELDYITRSRLEELATKFKDGLIEDDEESAMEYFTEECEMTPCEMEFFGIEMESEDE